MEWLWLVQLMLNLVIVVFLFVWWKERVPARQTAERSFLREADPLEQQVALFQDKAERQLKLLHQICQQAQTILARHRIAEGGVSVEEEELKALRETPAPLATGTVIPTVEEIQATKQSLQPQIPMDLRSLLRDQLS